MSSTNDNATTLPAPLPVTGYVPIPTPTPVHGTHVAIHVTVDSFVPGEPQYSADWCECVQARGIM